MSVPIESRNQKEIICLQESSGTPVELSGPLPEGVRHATSYALTQLVRTLASQSFDISSGPWTCDIYTAAVNPTNPSKTIDARCAYTASFDMDMQTVDTALHLIEKRRRLAWKATRAASHMFNPEREHHPGSTPLPIRPGRGVSRYQRYLLDMQEIDRTLTETLLPHTSLVHYSASEPKASMVPNKLIKFPEKRKTIATYAAGIALAFMGSLSLGGCGLRNNEPIRESSVIIISNGEFSYGPAALETKTEQVIRASGEQNYSDIANIINNKSLLYSINPNLLTACYVYFKQENMQPNNLSSDSLIDMYAAWLLDGYYGSKYRNERQKNIPSASGTTYQGWKIPESDIPEDNNSVDATYAVKRLIGIFSPSEEKAKQHWVQFSEFYNTNYGTESRSAADPVPQGLQINSHLPFVGTFLFTGPPHDTYGTGGGPWGAIDFAPRDVTNCNTSAEWVIANEDGEIVYSDNGHIYLDTDGDGNIKTGTDYFFLHIASQDRLQTGIKVKRGDRIGHPGCEGGTSTGTHFHFAVRVNGEWLPVVDSRTGKSVITLDGWTFKPAQNQATYHKDTFTMYEGVAISSNGHTVTKNEPITNSTQNSVQTNESAIDQNSSTTLNGISSVLQSAEFIEEMDSGFNSFGQRRNKGTIYNDQGNKTLDHQGEEVAWVAKYKKGDQIIIVTQYKQNSLHPEWGVMCVVSDENGANPTNPTLETPLYGSCEIDMESGQLIQNPQSNNSATKSDKINGLSNIAHALRNVLDSIISNIRTATNQGNNIIENNSNCNYSEVGVAPSIIVNSAGAKRTVGEAYDETGNISERGKETVLWAKKYKAQDGTVVNVAQYQTYPQWNNGSMWVMYDDNGTVIKFGAGKFNPSTCQ